LGWIALWALASLLQPQRQFWHDIWAGTRLIDMRSAVKD
ncbi:MAG: RDD family protein, partial [Burkholderiaceae bacterium]|nr:RDD family protein [Burkholderiaceae bacterium]